MGFAQTGEETAPADEPFYRLTPNQFMARYNAIAPQVTGNSEPYLLQPVSDGQAVFCSTVMEHVYLSAKYDDSLETIEQVVVGLDTSTLMKQNVYGSDGELKLDMVRMALVLDYAPTCEIAIRAADPTLTDDDVQDIFLTTVAEGIPYDTAYEGVLMAKMNGIRYRFTVLELSGEPWHCFFIQAAE
ncbi:MAG: hypothetical protein LBM74_08385 [Oscillospiraceae bacterium]|nr:hypothetical protein [Oscillospiraceae bacterium]